LIENQTEKPKLETKERTGSMLLPNKAKPTPRRSPQLTARRRNGFGVATRNVDIGL
jgi:hypothetical protein